jgi:CDP-glycerol glycerophosphotransferase (TagB/SpsB family)
MFFDASRLVVIGRPQARDLPREGGGPFTILYAPTWEGTQAANAHSSILTHAARLLGAATPERRVIFRPHPRTGRSDAAHKAELAALVQASSGRADAVELDTSPNPSGAMARADALVTDVSAMAVDWLATGRPLILTSIDRPGTAVVDSLLLSSMPRLAAAQAGDVGDLAASLVGDAAHAEALARARSHYLGDLVGDHALDAFIAACTQALARRDAAWAALSTEETSP